MRSAYHQRALCFQKSEFKHGGNPRSCALVCVCACVFVRACVCRCACSEWTWTHHDVWCPVIYYMTWTFTALSLSQCYDSVNRTDFTSRARTWRSRPASVPPPPSHLPLSVRLSWIHQPLRQSIGGHSSTGCPRRCQWRISRKPPVYCHILTMTRPVEET